MAAIEGVQDKGINMAKKREAKRVVAQCVQRDGHALDSWWENFKSTEIKNKIYAIAKLMKSVKGIVTG